MTQSAFKTNESWKANIFENTLKLKGSLLTPLIWKVRISRKPIDSRDIESKQELKGR
jgi:hypothetical protein